MSASRTASITALLAGVMLLAGAAPLVESEAARAQRVQSMTPEEKARLIQKKERFDSLAPQTRQQLRTLHEQISSAPNAKRLLGVVDRYHQWHKTLSAAQQSELMSLPIKERISKIREFQQAQARSHFQDLARRLEKEDLETIYDWMEAFVARQEDAILSKVDPGLAARVLFTPDPKIRRYMLVGAVFGPRRQGENGLPLPTAEDFHILATRLSPTLQYELLALTSDEDRRNLIMTCARAAWWSRFAPPPPSDEELSKFYMTLDQGERDRVERLEPQQMKRELTRLYHGKKFRDAGGRLPGAPGESGRSSRGDGARSRRNGSGSELPADNAERPSPTVQEAGKDQPPAPEGNK